MSVLMEPYVSKLERENEVQKRTITALGNDLQTLQGFINDLAAKAQQKDTVLAELRAKHQQTLDQLSSATSLIQEYQLNAAVKENSELKDRIWRGETERRYLRNQLLELKGNIRVFCRVRPMLSVGFGDAVQTIEFPMDSDSKLVIFKPNDNGVPTPMHGKNSSVAANLAFDVTSHPFEFEKVFKPGSRQMEIFEEISQFVQAFKMATQRKTASFDPRNAKLPGLRNYTVDQLFFLSYGQEWCELWTPKSQHDQIRFDKHSVNEYRANVVLQNNEDFAKAYGCPLGSPMNPEHKCRLW